MQVQIPDDSDFLSFRDQCLGTDGWLSRYSKKGVTVWIPQEAEEGGGVQKVKVRRSYLRGQLGALRILGLDPADSAATH